MQQIGASCPTNNRSGDIDSNRFQTMIESDYTSSVSPITGVLDCIGGGILGVLRNGGSGVGFRQSVVGGDVSWAIIFFDPLANFRSPFWKFMTQISACALLLLSSLSL